MDGPQGCVADVMTTAPMSVSAGDTAASASAILRAHRLPVVPVLEAGSFAGVLAPLDLLGERPYRLVGDLMTRGIVPAAPDLPLLQAHALLASQRLEVLPVLQDDRVVGHLTLSAVLRAINQQTDPLTGLPWAAALRIWATDALARRREVAILFIDLDNFREVNKALGHVAGDGVLRTIADLLRQCVDPTIDLLCRYGGDEFAIATVRTEEQARALAARVQEVVTVPADPGDPERRVTVSVGYAGGRRREDREPGHAGATADDLLTLASRASTAAKSSAGAEARRAVWHPKGPLPAEARALLVDASLESAAGRSSARVRLRLGTREVIGVSSGLLPEPAARFIVADAALQALHRILGEAHVYSLEDVIDSLRAPQPLVIVVLSRDNGGGDDPQRYIGGATARELPLAVCKAVLGAVNRPLARRLGALLQNEAGP